MGRSRITAEFSDELLGQITARAREIGLPRNQYINEVMREKLGSSEPIRFPGRPPVVKKPVVDQKATEAAIADLNRRLSSAKASLSIMGDEYRQSLRWLDELLPLVPDRRRAHEIEKAIRPYKQEGRL